MCDLRACVCIRTGLGSAVCCFLLRLVFLVGDSHILRILFLNTSSTHKIFYVFRTSVIAELTVREVSLLEKWNFLFYCNSAAQAPGGVVGSHFATALTSAFLCFAAAHMVDYYHFMVTVISNLVENDS